MQKTISFHAFREFGKLPLDGKLVSTKPTFAGLQELFATHKDELLKEEMNNGICSQKKGAAAENTMVQFLKTAFSDEWKVKKNGPRGMDIHISRDEFVGAIEIKNCKSVVPYSKGRNKIQRDIVLNDFDCNAVLSTVPLAGITLRADNCAIVGDTLFLVRSPPWSLEQMSPLFVFIEERHTRFCLERSGSIQTTQLARQSAKDLVLQCNLDMVNVAANTVAEQIKLYLALVSKQQRADPDAIIASIIDRLQQQMYPVKLNSTTYTAIASQYPDVSEVAASSNTALLRKAAAAGTAKRKRC